MLRKYLYLLFLLLFTIQFVETNFTAKFKLSELAEYDSKYINDFLTFTQNKTSASEIIESSYYDYNEFTKSSNPDDENQWSTPKFSDIYPDPDKLLVANNVKNSTKITEESSVIKIYTKKMVKPTKYEDDMISFDNLNNDLKGHDFIDSIMYIYYGTKEDLRKDIGANVIVIGAVFGLAAQILTIVILYLKNRRIRRRNSFFPIVTNLLIILCLSNLIFILGVQATKVSIKCEIIALILHYLHLSTSVWCLIYIYIIYDLLLNDCGPTMKYNYLVGYGGPAIYVMFSYAASMNSFEIRKYCWMSIHKGMIVNFMIPISILIIATAILGTLTLKKISEKQTEILCESIESIIESTTTTNKCMETIYMNTNTNNLKNLQLNEYMDKCCVKNFHSSVENNNNNSCDEDGGDCDGISGRHNKGDDGSCAGIDINDSGISSNECVDANGKRLDCCETKIDIGITLSLADLSSQSTSDIQDFSDFKRATKFALFFQPIFCICWFLGVLALENRCVMPSIYTICYNILNWCILIRSSNICPFIYLNDEQNTNSGKSNVPHNDDLSQMNEDINPNSTCTDTIPLLTTPGVKVFNNNHSQSLKSINFSSLEDQFNSSSWDVNLDGDISTISN